MVSLPRYGKAATCPPLKLLRLGNSILTVSRSLDITRDENKIGVYTHSSMSRYRINMIPVTYVIRASSSNFRDYINSHITRPSATRG